MGFISLQRNLVYNVIYFMHNFDGKTAFKTFMSINIFIFFSILPTLNHIPTLVLKITQNEISRLMFITFSGGFGSWELGLLAIPHRHNL